MSEGITRPPTVHVSAEEFSVLFRALCRWGRLGLGRPGRRAVFPDARACGRRRNPGTRWRRRDAQRAHWPRPDRDLLTLLRDDGWFVVGGLGLSQWDGSHDGRAAARHRGDLQLAV